ncbi:unnamed protein product [Ceutorhynchus assimilis]|uniref:Ribosome biogenesis protein NOP53 n=1 Tax=Ceutorhynchus assimilis TaxID=467358 RepID=A0A9N9QJ75_9CUCU|nr:unnamed protein product [Ceutorhynchus assimilis]
MASLGIKRKRVSKKNKLAWRKHSKVADVEQFLDEQWEEERLGAIEALPDDQLFVLDSKPDKATITTRQSKKLRATRPLKGFAALQPHTSVPDPIKKRNRVQTKEERKSDLVKKKELDDRRNGVLKLKEINAIAERRLYELKRDKKEKRGEFNKDVWSEEADSVLQNDPWAEKVTKVHNLRNTGVPVKNRPIKSKSLLQVIEPPHPGTSYNPSFKDHQDLLRTVAQEETKIIKEEKHLDRVTRQMFRRVTSNKKDSEWMVEMSQGMTNKEEKEIKEEPEDLDKISINPPVQNKKKSVQQRRKQREQLTLENQLRAKKLDKKKIGDIHTIKVLEKDLQKLAKKQEKLREVRKIRAEKNKLKPKVLSSTKFEDYGPDFQMGQDIAGNLRSMKKEGNLLSDRFKSLQKRNILEPSKRAHYKKPKVKKYTKPGHKDDWETTVARRKITSK